MTFPSNPNDDDLHEAFGRKLRYRSGKWQVVSSPTVATVTEEAPKTEAVAQAVDLPMTGNEVGAMTYVQESNRLYVWNGSGWFEVALVNTNPTITAGGSATYELATDGTPTVITLTANDPEGIPIAWSYAVTSGSLGGTTVSNVDNVFTITPSTNLADAGTFQLTFTASDGVNVDTSASSFSLSFGIAAEILLVGGGGAGGNGWAAGGGGGGGGTVIHDTSAFLQSGTQYNIVVGAGANAYSSMTGFGEDQGGSSSAFGYIAPGGGSGGEYSQNDTAKNARSGGSGGGGNGNGVVLNGTVTNTAQQQGAAAVAGTIPAGNTTAIRYQNAGGNGVQWGTYSVRGAGGGGGAGAAGQTSYTSGGSYYAGSGGNGVQISITGTPTYYGGGGAGGWRGSVVAGSGGLGGGAAERNPGVDGLGGGGGGGLFTQTVDNNRGGSGVVIIRTLVTATATTGNPTVTTQGSYKIYKFLQNGSITF